MLVARCHLRAPSPLVVKRKAKAWKFVGEFLWRRSFQKDEAAFVKKSLETKFDLQDGPRVTTAPNDVFSARVSVPDGE